MRSSDEGPVKLRRQRLERIRGVNGGHGGIVERFLAGGSFQQRIGRGRCHRGLIWNVVYTTPLSPIRADSGITAIPIALQRGEKPLDVVRKIDALRVRKDLRRQCPLPGPPCPGPRTRRH